MDVQVLHLISRRRFDIRAILADPAKRRRLLALTLQATQAREGRDLTLAQAYQVVDRVEKLTAQHTKLLDEVGIEIILV